MAPDSLWGDMAWRTTLTQPMWVRQWVLVDLTGYPLQPQSLLIDFRLAPMSWLAPVTQKILPKSMVVASMHNVYGQPDEVRPALVDR